MQSTHTLQDTLVTKTIQYHNKISNQAAILLGKLLSPIPNALKRLTTLHVLVVGAGTFPSFNAFMEQISAVMPNLTKVNFTLVESQNEMMDVFSQHVSRENYLDKIHLQFDYHKQDVKDFLQTATAQHQFDMVYLEHPDTHILPILPAKLGFKRFAAILSLREAIPLLKNVMKSDSMLIASCMSKQEVNQLRRLLQAGLEIATHGFSFAPRRQFFYAGPYMAGLYSILCFPKNKKDRAQLSKKIRRSDNAFCIALVFSFLCYFFGVMNGVPMLQRFLSVMLLALLVLLHQPGRKGRMIRWMLVGLITILNVL